MGQKRGRGPGRARSVLGFFAWLASLVAAKAIMLSIVAFFSLAMTIASFTIPALAKLASGAATWMFGQTAVMTVAESSNLRQSNRRLQAANSELSTRNRQLDENNRQLRSTNQRLENQMSRQRRVAATGANRIKRRSAIQATRSISAIPTESIPIIGITTIMAMTAWDIRDACWTIEDMSEIQTSLGEDPDDGFATRICDTLYLQRARSDRYRRMTVSQCRTEASATREQILEVARAARDEIPDLIDPVELDSEIMQVAQEEFDAINEICDCIADLACNIDDLSEQ